MMQAIADGVARLPSRPMTPEESDVPNSRVSFEEYQKILEIELQAVSDPPALLTSLNLLTSTQITKQHQHGTSSLRG
jgi:hypothetical protein